MIYSEIFAILILVILNGILSMAEMAIVSARSAKLIIFEREGKTEARKIIELIEDPTEFLSIIQVGMSAISICIGIFSGATLSAQLAIWTENLPYLSSYAYPVSVITVIFGVTYFAVLFGELVPKRIAAAFPERVSILLVPKLLLLQHIIGPLLWLLRISINFLVKKIDYAGEEDSEVTEEEIKIVVSQGAEIGAIGKEEEQIVHKALRLDDRPVSSFMSPRTEVIWLNLADSTDLNWQKVCESHHTNFPVAYHNIDDLRGLLTVNKFAKALRDNNQLVNLESCIHEVLKVPPNTTALDLIRLFRANCTSFAVIVDEHGGVDGIVTIHDLTELLVGELDTNEEDITIKIQDNGNYVVDACVDISDLIPLLNWNDKTLEEERDYTSLAGLLLDKLGRIPHEGDSLIFGHHEFEVIKMNGHHIDKVVIKKHIIDHS